MKSKKPTPITDSTTPPVAKPPQATPAPGKAAAKPLPTPPAPPANPQPPAAAQQPSPVKKTRGTAQRRPTPAPTPTPVPKPVPPPVPAPIASPAPPAIAPVRKPAAPQPALPQPPPSPTAVVKAIAPPAPVESAKPKRKTAARKKTTAPAAETGTVPPSKRAPAKRAAGKALVKEPPIPTKPAAPTAGSAPQPPATGVAQTTPATPLTNTPSRPPASQSTPEPNPTPATLPARDASKSTPIPPTPAPADPAPAVSKAPVSTPVATIPPVQPEPSPAPLPLILLTDDRGTVKTKAVSEPGASRESSPAEGRPAVVALPEILLTGDRPAVSIDPGPEMLPIPEPSAPSVWVGAQDPHTLCVQWEMPAGQLQAAKSSSEDGGLHLRVVADAPAPQCVIEERVSPGDSMAFVPVPNAGVPYHAEIGVRTQEGSWQVIADSSPTSAPPASPARDESYVEGYWSSQEISKEAPSFPTAPPPAGIDLPGAGFATDWAATPSPAVVHGASPEPSPTPSPQTPTVRTARRLIRLSLGADSVQESYSSHSLAAGRDAESWEEWNESEASALETFPNPDLPSSEAGPAPENPSSPLAVPTTPKSFWFRINAEVILYGSTEPNATLTIGTQSVKVRPDGTFSFRFALPDGAFPLPVVATAADGSDSRAARVEFTRSTQLQGEVGTHPQDPALKPPLPENCAPGSDVT